MRKNQKSVSFYLSDEEKKALDQVRGKLSYREYILRGTVDPRKRGRPSLDAAKKALDDQHERRDKDERKRIHDQLVAANARGLSEDIRRRMFGDEEWHKMICINCKHKYQTSLLMSTCPVCSQVNRYKLPPTELPLGEPVFLNQPLSETEVEGFEEQRKGNLSEGYNPEYKGIPVGSEKAKTDEIYYKLDHMFKYGKKKKKR